MTKSRAPVSIENAIHRIAGHIGYAEMARACGYAERTVRNWGDPDTPENCPCNAARELDLAYSGASGDGFPIYEAMGLMLEVESARRFSDRGEIARLAAVSAKESGEAVAALIVASRNGATDADLAHAAREVEESVSALTATLPMLIPGNGSAERVGEGEPRGGDA